MIKRKIKLKTLAPDWSRLIPLEACQLLCYFALRINA